MKGRRSSDKSATLRWSGPCRDTLYDGALRMMTKAQFFMFLAIGALALGGLSGCVSVAAYEHGTLAHPSMSPEEMATGFDEHVRAVSEGAAGGFGGGGGGCGCN